MDSVPAIQKVFFTSADRTVTNRVKRHALETCRFKIPEAYIQRAFNKFKRGLYYMYGDTIYGFILWREYTEHPIINIHDALDFPPTHYMYVLLVCTQKNTFRLGERILKDIDMYCVNRNLSYILLQASDLNTMIFYEKSGYVISNPHKLYMKKNVAPFHISREGRKKTRRAGVTRPRRRAIDEFTPEEARAYHNFTMDTSALEPHSP
jgi:hypothetical protein